MNEKKYSDVKILGMMSGTSGDGIDGALVKFTSEEHFKLIWHKHFPFSEAERKHILNLQENPDIKQIVLGNSFIAKLYAEAFNSFIETDSDRPDFIAAHGQTIAHFPDPENVCGRKVSGTLQLLDGCGLAEYCNVGVISNFRARDMALGGQGAPLVPFADKLFFSRNFTELAVIVNLGGIANITVLEKEMGKVSVKSAYDVGPANMLMDNYIQRISNGESRYDKGGKMASSGIANQELVRLALSNPFFSRKPPKSTGRELFGDEFLDSILQKFNLETPENIMASLLEITAQSLLNAIDQESQDEKKIDLIAIAGGGALNDCLVNRLKHALAEKVKIVLSDELGIPVMAREAMAFAALGYAFVNQMPSNVIAATGADKEVVLGEWHPAYK